ncbi:MAG: H-X9-DG-CTERM domain-containing protein, partial [Isosphaeraceae bacterium]
AWTAGSRHGPGVNVSFADGHVRFVRDTITLSVWRAIGTRNGGEVIGEESF